MRTNWQVCSLVVQAKSQNIAAIGTQLNTLPGCEVALSDVESGQLIVVAEAEQSETLMQTIESVRNVEGVLAVSLVYHQQDEQGEETPGCRSERAGRRPRRCRAAGSHQMG
ncbi:chaperone NapD [Salmonella enterica]|nr:chaperone NapD [Salmonella enterica]